MTRYNWQVDSSNSANDWYFIGGIFFLLKNNLNLLNRKNSNCISLLGSGISSPTPGASMDYIIQQNNDLGTKTVLTVPMIQYINALSAWHCSFPSNVYTETQQSYDPYLHPNGDNCGNGVVSQTGKNIFDSHILSHDIPNTPEIQTSWVQHIIKYYFLDIF